MSFLSGRKLSGKPWLVSVALSASSVGPGASGGTAATLTQSTNLLARRIFQRDVASGSPTGFPPIWQKGWGAVTLAINASQASAGLFAELYDADSSGAIAEGPGTGTLLQASVQVSANIASGTSALTINLPAAPKFFYLDLALDGAMTFPIRVPVPFGVGALTGIMTRSFGSMLISQYAYSGTIPDPDSIVNVPANAGASFGGTDYRYGPVPGATWVPPAGYNTPGGMEYIRLMSSQLGVVHGICGVGAFGGDMNIWNSRGGSGFGTFASSWVPQMGGKFRYFLLMANGGPYSKGQLRRLINDIMTGVQAMSSIPVICLYDGMGWWVPNGTAYGGYGWNVSLAQEMERLRAGIVAADVFDANRYIAGHSSFQARVRMARQLFRRVTAAETTGNGGFGGGQGPTITNAVRVPGSYVIEVGFQHGGGSTLTGYSWNEPIVNETPNDPGCVFLTPASYAGDYVTAFQVYLAGQNANNAYVKLDYEAGVTIDNVNRRVSVPFYQPGSGMIEMSDGTLVALTDSMAFNLVYGQDYNFYTPPSGVSGALLTDERVDTANGIPYGWGLRGTPDGIYVPAPAPPAQALAVTTPLTTLAGGLMKVSGRGSGLPVSGLQVALNSGTKQSPIGLVLGQDNTWSGFIAAPNVSSTNSISVYRAGQSAADATSGNFAAVSRRTMMGAGPDASFAGLSAPAVTSLVVSYVAPNFCYQDLAGTVPMTGDIGSAPPQATLAWRDELGANGNMLVATGSPALDFRCFTPALPGIVFEYGQSMATPGVATLASQMLGDYTVLCISREHDNGYLWQVSGSGANPNNGFFVQRGSNTLNVPNPPFAVTSGIYTVTLVRYQASTGLLEAFCPQCGTTNALASNTAYQGEAVTPSPLVVAPNDGPVYALQFFSSRFSDNDKNALLAWAAANFG